MIPHGVGRPSLCDCLAVADILDPSRATLTAPSLPDGPPVVGAPDSNADDLQDRVLGVGDDAVVAQRQDNGLPMRLRAADDVDDWLLERADLPVHVATTSRAAASHRAAQTHRAAPGDGIALGGAVRQGGEPAAIDRASGARADAVAPARGVVHDEERERDAHDGGDEAGEGDSTLSPARQPGTPTRAL